MIIAPDFPDHWKTRLLVELLDDEAAPVYLIRLWGHAQNRKTDRFTDLPIQAIKVICRYNGDAQRLFDALIAAGFIHAEDGIVTLIGWKEYNSSLFTSWENGKKGGRPRAQKKTRGFPVGNPQVSRGEPVANPNETDKRREEKIREDERGEEAIGSSFEELNAQGKYLEALSKLVALPIDNIMAVIAAHSVSDEVFDAWRVRRAAEHWKTPRGKPIGFTNWLADLQSFQMSWDRNQAQNSDPAEKPSKKQKKLDEPDGWKRIYAQVDPKFEGLPDEELPSWDDLPNYDCRKVYKILGLNPG